jgi:hypothetical protein
MKQTNDKEVEDEGALRTKDEIFSVMTLMRYP